MSPGGVILSCVAACAALPPTPGRMAFATDVHISQRVVRLGDVADLSTVPVALRARAASLAIADLPVGRNRLTLSTRWSMERARVLMPALTPWLGGGDGSTITVRLVSGPSDRLADPTPCLVLKAALPSGAIAAARDFAPASCERNQAMTALRHDSATGLVRTGRDLQIGDHVAMVPSSELAAILPGERLYLSTQVGPVRIDRQVEAVQPAAQGQAVFVRGDAGPAFSVPAGGLTP